MLINGIKDQKSIRFPIARVTGGKMPGKIATFNIFSNFIAFQKVSSTWVFFGTHSNFSYYFKSVMQIIIEIIFIFLV